MCEKLSEIQNKIKALNQETENKYNLPQLNNWTKNNVEIWLKKKGFNSAILKCLGNCDVKILYELYSIRTEAPNFFYDKISSETSQEISLRDFCYFSDELKKLFEKV